MVLEPVIELIIGFLVKQAARHGPRTIRGVMGRCHPDQAVDFFQQATRFLERAASIFSEQISEPIRLWEAYNEQGSLYCDWGWLLRQHGKETAAQEQYDKAVRHQMHALEIAQRYGLHFQEADTCDDLAQVWADRGNIDKARQWLAQGLSLVPAEFTLKAGEGFQGAPESGEVYWLILGKAHLQQGIWAMRSVGQDSPTDDQRMEHIRDGVEHLALAAAYFQRYWPGTAMLRARLRSMARYLGKAGVSADESKTLISQVASQYGVDLTTFLDVVDAGPVDTSDHS